MCRITWSVSFSMGLLTAAFALADERAEDIKVKSVGSASCINRDARGDFIGWADTPHCLVDQRAQSTIRFLDNYYGSPSVQDTASVFLRAIGETTLDQQGALTPAMRVRADLQLPRINKRLSLVFENERTDINRQAGLPATTQDASLALRWLAVNLKRLQIEADAGVRSGPDVFVRARLRRSWTLGQDDFVRLSQIVRYGAREELRVINQIELTHAFGNNLAATAFHSLDYQQTASGDTPTWLRGILLARGVGLGAAASVGAGQEGLTRPSWRTESRFVWMRWRQQFMRDWLFYEVEPRLTQARDSGWDTLTSLTLRLEVQFGGAGIARPELVPPASAKPIDSETSVRP